MRRLRARLAVIAVGLLLLQIGATAVSSLNACCSEPASSTAMQCCREGGAAHMCPLTKKSTASPSPCQMRACGSGHDHRILLGGLIGLPVPHAVFVLGPRIVHVSDFVASPLRRSPIPPSPPPRA